MSILFPDGQIRFASGLVHTDEPFRPDSIEELRRELLLQKQFADFHVLQTPHYLVLYKSSEKFAESSAKLLEDLYKCLTEAFRKRDVLIQNAEFPLVAVIFRTEADFRAFKPVQKDVQAYYEIMTNRIYFYQNSEHDQFAPEVAALRRPQTVAHEGTHQILSNIGIQPRLGAWPLWLVEGLAEYCSPPVTSKKGAIAWKGLGAVNALHMATIRDLEDPASTQVRGAAGPRIGRDPKMPLVEYLVTRSELTPTDYALSWAMTHYLAQKRGNSFVAFLKKMSQMRPLQEHSPEEHLAMFREAFGADLAKLDKAIGVHLAKVKYEPLPYYAVMFEQPIGLGRFKRAAIVSQSPSMIRQWVETLHSPNGGEPHWVAEPYPNRSRAIVVAEEWMGRR